MNKRFLLLIIILILTSYVALEYYLVFPQVQSSDKSIILYYDTLNLPFNATTFPHIISFVISNHFNTLMVVVYAYGHPLFNYSEMTFFSTYSRSHNVTFVPSYYIVSLDNKINTTGFEWVNLDMESLKTPAQSQYFSRITSAVPHVSVTSPYGQNLPYEPYLEIVETYYNVPEFWFYQLWFSHSSIMCSVSAHSASRQTVFDQEYQYCLDHSKGVMVFDYYNMLKSNLTVP
jgi:hypothetical protein